MNNHNETLKEKILDALEEPQDILTDKSDEFRSELSSGEYRRLEEEFTRVRNDYRNKLGQNPSFAKAPDLTDFKNRTRDLKNARNYSELISSMKKAIAFIKSKI